MPKQRRASGRAEATPTDPRALGLRHFQAGRFEQAINAWQPVGSDPKVRAALAEAYFRRSLTLPDQQRADDLRLALALQPDDARLHYQLGLLLHRQGNLAAAQEHYERVAQINPRWQGLGRVQGLAAIERGDRSEPASGARLSAGDRQLLNAVATLLRGEVPPEGGEDRLSHFWRGLGLLRTGDVAGAQRALSGGKPNRIGAQHSYYSGLAAALTGDAQGALAAWHYAVERNYRPAWLLNNLTAVRYAELQRLMAEGKNDEAAALAQGGALLPTGNSALASLEIEVLDGAARAAAAEGNWVQAMRCWEAARTIMSSADGLGSPRPLLHNLALAHEALERWLDAAEAWRAMLRTRPRKNATSAGDLSDAQWSWVRRRVIECYKRANEPGEAVAVFRQAIKADPADIDLRLELSDALLANDQPQAAYNEIQRVLDRDPNHIEALLRVAGYHLSRHMWVDAEQALDTAAKQNPSSAEVRDSLGYMFGQLGSEYNEFSRYAQAYRAFSQAAHFAPESFLYQIDLARVSFNRKHGDEARKHLEEALRLGADQSEAYVLAIDCWVFEQNEDEARAVIARAESALPVLQDFYLEAGASLLEGSDFNLAFLNPFSPPTKRTYSDNAWTKLGQELFDRAIAQRSDDPQIRAQIASMLVQTRPDIGLRYIGDAVQLAPDVPQFQVLQGLLQALTDDKNGARTTLQKAARLARKQGNREIAEQADQMRNQINSPFFGLAMQMGGLFDEDDDDEDDEWE